MTDELVAELGDLVEWGEAIYAYHRGLPRSLLSSAPRGTIISVYKQGGIKVKMENGDRVALSPGDFTIISKAG